MSAVLDKAKQFMELNKHDGDDYAGGPLKTAPPETNPEVSSDAEGPKRFRRLKANELVRRGDFVADDHQAFELWDGPMGFRADAFVKAVYRRDESGSRVPMRICGARKL
jgi:hypothetical protein